MLRRTKAAKLEEWTRRLKRFAKSGQSVTEFCRAEGVSTPSFYQWRQRLESGRRKKKRAGSQRGKSPAFQRLQVLPQPDTPSSVRVRLPDGIVLELGSDWPTIERIVGQLLDRQARAVRAC